MKSLDILNQRSYIAGGQTILNLPSPLPTLPRLPGVREDSLSKYSPGFLAAKQNEILNKHSQALLS